MSVSIVIPLYNKAPYIHRALDSVLRQSFQDFECIVVDDGSTDSGGAVVQGFGDPRIRLVRQRNDGVSRARNIGIELARHPLIALLDADDEWLPEFLGASLEMHREHPEIVASFTDYRQGPVGKPVLCEPESRARVLRDYFAFCLRHRGSGMCSSAVMARRDTLLNIGGFPAGRFTGEDLDTWARLAWSGPVAFIPDVLSIYHRVADSACVKHLACGDMLPTFQQWRLSGRVPPALARSSAAYIYLFRFHDVHALVSVGEAKKARTLYSEVPWLRRFSVMGISAYFGSHIPWCSRYARRVGTGLGCLLPAWRWFARA